MSLLMKDILARFYLRPQAIYSYNASLRLEFLLAEFPNLNRRHFLLLSMNFHVLPKNLKSIGEKAFSGCKVLKELTIPQSVTSVGMNVFSGCSAITLLYKISVAKKYNTDVF